MEMVGRLTGQRHERAAENWSSQIAMSNPAAKMGLRRPPYGFTELVVTAQGRKNQCATPLRLGQAGEWKMQDYDAPSYKSAQAACSPGESQSSRSEERRVGKEC